MSKFAKALYDNVAECPDELAFRRGDVVTVLEQSVADTSGWWMCSLHGRRGLAPANRLELLLQTSTAAERLRHDRDSDVKVQNIYQIPSTPRPISSPAYERMDIVYKVPSVPLSASCSPIMSALRQSPDGTAINKPSFCMASSPKQVYDVPPQSRGASLPVESSPSLQMAMQKPTASVPETEKKSETAEPLRGNDQRDSCVYAVPPPVASDPNYDILPRSATEHQRKLCAGFSTLPSPQKQEWIYDVPAGSEKQSNMEGNYDTLPARAECRHVYDTLPARRSNPDFLIYDTPNASKLLPPLSDKHPTERLPPEQDHLSQVVSDASEDHKDLERRGDPNKTLEHKRVRLQRMRNFLACASFPDLPGGGKTLVAGEEQLRLSTEVNQRISTASSSSTSSCDSLPLSSSSPEPLREVTLCQEDACRKLLELQESVCGAVPRLMDFVSSNWRSKTHLEKHLQEIQVATEKVVSALTCFLNFALDVRGNSRRLTDTNLQVRLHKQLSIVEDSVVILQQTASSLNATGWALDSLCQDPGQVQNPDQLDRFVMVARTVPDDVRRLVSIIYGNGKLLFKAPPRDQEPVSSRSPPQTKEGLDKPESESGEDDNDYVELQKKTEERRPEETNKEAKESVSPVCQKAEPRSSAEEQQPSLSEHCRLYFGALQKAIAGFVESLRNNQPPEKFISQSKLVIMVGQRLVNTLCKEAARRGSCQSLLCKSNHLCALLKQLAVATKKAAVYYPDKQALLEVLEFAKELAQRAQHFRKSLAL
ncbi:cas scaffolding protein family member 4 [Cyprinodon tularosa]|uniref:cas scaffolding protein family member 4 n=1 Tax=Cyprinodon tularosa TaxID=77115 RepID=UPI0018E21AE5|nr:cas scaffolding protein family member 4 [Cyprinodon tularosa]